MRANKFAPAPLEERFWEKVDRRGPDECWPWTGNSRPSRYGARYGVIFTTTGPRMATHVSWEFAHGLPFPQGMDACHKCDNPPCVNPSHLFAGTRGDNMQDAWDKGRQPRKRKPKTHCVRGHAFTPENTASYGTTGFRTCLTCKRAKNRAFQVNRPSRAVIGYRQKDACFRGHPRSEFAYYWRGRLYGCTECAKVNRQIRLESRAA